MSLIQWARIAVRPRRLLLIVPMCIVAVGVGCSHRRSVMRPVYSGQPVPSADCPSGDCGGSTPVVTPEGPTDSISEFGPAPDVERAGLSPIDETPPRATKGAPPAVTAPVTNPNQEPGFTPGASQGSEVPNLNKGASTSSRPRASFSTDSKARKTSTGRLRQTSAREQVRPFVSDEEDLFQPPKADRPWKYVVLHHSANPMGGYDSIDREHRSRLGWDGCGYHFIIGNGSESPDGQIEISQRWRNQKLGVHCRDGKNPDINEYGIGICLVGDLEKNPPTERQIESARALVSYLEERYEIAADRAETHSHLAMSPTSCPGRLFPTQAILKGESVSAVRETTFQSHH